MGVKEKEKKKVTVRVKSTMRSCVVQEAVLGWWRLEFA